MEDPQDTLQGSTSPKPVKCFECKVTYPSIWELAQHVSKEHPFLPTVQCRRCHFMFWDHGQLASHWRQFHKRAVALCPICGICESEQVRLDLHIQELHRDEQKVYCRGCWALMKGTDSLREHVMKVHSKDVITCRDCDGEVLFSTEEGLEKHKEEIHMTEEERIGKCDICGLECGSLTAKRWHRSEAHPTVFPHRCEECGLRFRWARNLRRHLVGLHPNSQRTQSLVLKNIFVCNCCHITFGTIDAVARHYKIVHKNPHCSDCDSYFYSPRCLHRHQRRFASKLVIGCGPVLPEYVP